MTAGGSLSQVPKLKKLLETGHKNGVNDLIWLDAKAARALEPELRVHAALHSPSTGIVDSHRWLLLQEKAVQLPPADAHPVCVSDMSKITLARHAPPKYARDAQQAPIKRESLVFPKRGVLMAKSDTRMKRKAVCGLSADCAVILVRSLMLAYQADAESHGAKVALNTSIVAAEVSGVPAGKARFLCRSLDCWSASQLRTGNPLAHAHLYIKHGRVCSATVTLLLTHHSPQ